MGTRNLRSDRFDNSKTMRRQESYRIRPESIKSAHKSQPIHHRCYTIDRETKSPSCKSSADTRYKSPTFSEANRHTHIPRYKRSHPKISCHQLRSARSTSCCRTRKQTSLSIWPLTATFIIDDCLSSRRTFRAPLLYRKPARHALDSRPFARKRSRAVCACAVLGGLCGSPSGIAPFCECVSDVRRACAIIW